MAGVLIFDMDSLVRLKTHFPRDVAPAVWTAIEYGAGNGSIVLHNEVRREILRGGGEDALLAWAEANRRLFTDITTAQTEIVTEERKRGPGSCQVPNVCVDFDLAHMNLLDFMRLMDFQIR